MTNSSRKTDNASGVVRFEESLREIATFLDNASEEEKDTALRLLKASPLLEWLKILELEEQRVHPRKDCSIQIDYATWKGASNATVQNISAGGMFIETDKKLSTGERITASIFLPNQKEPIRVSGEIVWTPRKGVGVKFTSPLSENLKNVIESL